MKNYRVSFMEFQDYTSKDGTVLDNDLYIELEGETEEDGDISIRINGSKFSELMAYLNDL